MGRVYKAVHRPMDRVVALKILAPQSIDGALAQQLFRHEIRAAAQLNHPHIVMAFDANEHKGRHFLAMEFVDGPNLEQYVHEQDPLPIGLACEIIFQAANGLQHSHEKGVVHRDIKPANLLLQREPGSTTIQVKILDFGLARLRYRRKNTAVSPALMGTPDYLAPEQAHDVNEADVRSDLYSLGCTFYFLLTGQVPFPDGNVVHKLNRHDREQATPVETLRPDVPKNIANVVRKLMAKNPADRFQTPDELMEVLAPHADPTITAWQTKRSTMELACNKPTVLQDSQADTEPQAHGSTPIDDHDSLLEWVKTNRRQRDLARRKMLSAVGILSGLALGIVGLITWGFM